MAKKGKGVDVKIKVKDFPVYKQFKKAVKGVKSADVNVGYILGDKARQAGPAGNDIGGTNAGLAYVHTFGAPSRGIPPRPFLQPALEAKRTQCINFLKGGFKANFEQGPGASAKAFSMCGMAIRDEAKRIIREQVGFEPLKPDTLKARKRQKFAGTKALIRTGQLMNAITYEVKDA